MPRWLDRLLDPSVAISNKLQDTVVEQASRLFATIESFWPPISAIVVATLLQASLPDRVGQLRWIFVALSIVLLIVVLVVNPGQIERRHRPLPRADARAGHHTEPRQRDLRCATGDRPGERRGHPRRRQAPITGGAIWLTNVIVFSLWYWLFDRGGPYARVHTPDPFPAFMFPQMDKPDLAVPHWKPQYVDYLYLSFTDALAFSPTDVMPLKHWAKLTMLVQSLVSLMIAVLVIAAGRQHLPLTVTAT